MMRRSGAGQAGESRHRQTGTPHRSPSPALGTRSYSLFLGHRGAPQTGKHSSDQVSLQMSSVVPLE